LPNEKNLNRWISFYWAVISVYLDEMGIPDLLAGINTRLRWLAQIRNMKNQSKK